MHFLRLLPLLAVLLPSFVRADGMEDPTAKGAAWSYSYRPTSSNCPPELRGLSRYECRRILREAESRRVRSHYVAERRYYRDRDDDREPRYERRGERCAARAVTVKTKPMILEWRARKEARRLWVENVNDAYGYEYNSLRNARGDTEPRCRNVSDDAVRTLCTLSATPCKDLR